MKRIYIYTLFTLILSFSSQSAYSQNFGTRVQYEVHDIFEFLDSLYNNEEYPELLNILDNVINIKRKDNDVYTIAFADMLSMKASALYRLERPGAVEAGKEANLLISKLMGKYNERYYHSVTSLATYCYTEDMYPDCIQYENEALDIAEKLHMPLNFERLSTMCEGMNAKQLGVNGVFLMGRPMFDDFGSIIQGNNQGFSNLVNARKAFEDAKKATGGDGLEFADAEEKLALAHIAIGDTATAQNLLFSATCRRNIGEYDIRFLRSVLLHADMLAIERRTLRAQDQALYVINQLEDLKQDKSSLYIDALIVYAMQEAHIGAYNKLILKAMDIAQNQFGTDSPEYDRARFAYAQILYRTLSSTNDISGPTLDKIINLTNETYLWRKTHLGTQHSDFIMSLLALATFCEQNKQYSRSTDLFAEFIKCQSGIVKDNFIGMSYEQQHDYWCRFNHYYQIYIPRVLWNEAMEGSSTADASVCYDATLFSKGILQKSFAARHESEIAGNKESYDRFINGLSCTWQDVKSHLKSGEAAIEFVSFINKKIKITRTAQRGKDNIIHVREYPVGEIPQAIYGALVLTSQSPKPQFVPLCDLNMAGNIEINGKIQNSMLYDIIWKPILPYLKGINTVYFSPSDDFYNIPLESLASDDVNQPISDMFKMYRLSSTSMLAQDTFASTGKNAVIYGGINYDMTINEMQNDKNEYLASGFSDETSKASLLRGSRESSDEIEYLPGTLTEAQNITNCFKGASKTFGNTKMISGKKATETSLKALSGSGTKVIHIGTHGFYEPDAGSQPLVTLKDWSAYNEEDIALMRSGLLFAGAQNFFDGQDIPSNVDDGILTSQEISYLDLYGLDLVTLSACQTATGDVTSDGVFGLQRGFKKAGANSIIMSLWKVDDKATCKLMTEFYTNWLTRKMGKHEAFEEAKKTVRKTKEWSDPIYWAAFILLDGLK